MKKVIKKLFLYNFYLLLFILILSPFLINAQDPIDEYPGIPLVIYPQKKATAYTTDNLNLMAEMGVFAIVAPNGYEDDWQAIGDAGMMVIPQNKWVLPNDIVTYTDACYTVWEAEGTDENKGFATLYYNDSIGEPTPSNNAIVTNSTTPGTLIDGPGYYQYITYEEIYPNTIIEYTANFRLMIEEITTPPTNDLIVCEIQVTASDWDVTRDSTLESLELKISDFLPPDGPGWFEYKEFELPYDLSGFEDCSGNQYPSRSCIPENEISNGYMQFRVIWKGLPYLKLYVDKITVHDPRGKALVEDSPPKTAIKLQVGNYLDMNEVIGWYGQDEAASIDNYEPFRIVDSLIHWKSAQEDKYLRLHSGFAANWNGRFGNTLHGTHKLKSCVEFYKRAKLKNVQINMYNYHYPWKPGQTNWQTKNINYVIRDVLHTLNDYDENFSFSTQAGSYYRLRDGIYEQTLIIPSEEQLLYHVNIGLLFGAKELRLDPYFTTYFPPPNEQYLNTEGLVDENGNPNDLWYVFKNTIKPRLNGDFGKTIRKLQQVEQFDEINAFHPYNPLMPSPFNYIEEVEADLGIPPKSGDICFIDMGYFEDESDYFKKHFMIVNRYYSTYEGFKITFQNLDNYINWEVNDFLESHKTTIKPDANGKVTYLDGIPIGDAGFYSLLPVVLYGGNLDYDEEIYQPELLRGEMTIVDGATLTISSDYTIQRDITIDYGGSIVINPGTELKFENGARLIVNGTLTANGTEGNEITFDFTLPTGLKRNGIKLGTGHLNISNCIIKNAYMGIGTIRVSTENPPPAPRISNNLFDNCSGYGIYLNDFNGPVPLIEYNTINGSNYGISAIDISTITISQNEITDAKMGIEINQVTYAQVINNTIISDYNSVPGIMNGIFFNSSGGNIRGNHISGHTNGIWLANSSPQVGGNDVSGNLFHGLYVGTGSIPDLRGDYVFDPPLVYIISGYNDIYDNGGTLWDDPNDDGSEIFLSNSNILLFDGCNSILDDRVPDSINLFNTKLLINGVGEIPPISAEFNYWGNNPAYGGHDPTGRFGIPVNFAHFYTAPCALPEDKESPLLVKSSDGNIIDTVYSMGLPSVSLSPMESDLAVAESHFVSAGYNEAKTIYESIITDYSLSAETFEAYNRLYELNKIESAVPSQFEQLRQTYNTAIISTPDTSLQNMLNQLVNLCLIAEEEYIDAIDEFVEIIDQNPNTEKAVYAEIDALTTSLIAQGNGGTLGKHASGKYMVGDLRDYQSKLNKLFADNFAHESKNNVPVIPSDYQLYQNYPNPFNPLTKIRFDLPQNSHVIVKVYDILGREVRTLVNEVKNAGQHEVEFDASNFASGVYIYQIKAGEFISSKKMVVLK